VAGCLKEGVTIEELERKTSAQSDTAAAEEMQKAKAKLFATFQRRIA
jgi:hypothetical protein